MPPKLYRAKLKKIIGFKSGSEKQFKKALTHSSYSYEHRNRGLQSNQRLEFLGDAVLELVVSDIIFTHYPSMPEGKLTKLRATVVCEPSLAKAARELGLGQSLYMGKGEELNGGRNKPSILADAFEAVIGAVYLEMGLAACKELIVKYLGDLIDKAATGRHGRDYKTELQELLQQKSPEPLHYAILKEEGPDHEKYFTAGVYYRKRLMGTGEGHSKKLAEQMAAKDALIHYNNYEGEMG